MTRVFADPIYHPSGAHVPSPSQRCKLRSTGKDRLEPAKKAINERESEHITWCFCSKSSGENRFYDRKSLPFLDATFTTVIPTWPDVEDRRVISGLARVLWYIIWWIFIVRVISVYVIVLTISISLGHQYTILYQYFIDLNGIFDGKDGQDVKEKKYEDAFKVGIKMHALTLWCVRQAQVVGNVAYSAQIILNISVLVLTMFQMMNAERTLAGVAPIALMAGSVLIATGVFMWSAGDITIEASRLPTAVFQSGWHNCRGQSSKRVRKLVAVAITQAQEPVVLKVLGVIELSYQSYVSIVKSSYSLFSVIY